MSALINKGTPVKVWLIKSFCVISLKLNPITDTQRQSSTNQTLSQTCNTCIYAGPNFSSTFVCWLITTSQRPALLTLTQSLVKVKVKIKFLKCHKTTHNVQIQRR